MPEVTVRLPPVLRGLFQGCPPEQTVAAATVGGAIDALDQRFPGLRDRMCEPSGRIRRSLNVFVAGRRVGADAPLADGARIDVLTAIVGG